MKHIVLRLHCSTMLLPVLFLIAASISNIPAQQGGYFYVSDQSNEPRIAVYDHNLVFQHYIFSDYFHVPSGLDFLSNGNLVANSGGAGSRVMIYDPSGTVVSTFATRTANPLQDVKAGPFDRLYMGGEGVDGRQGIMEFTTNGKLIRTIPTLSNALIAVLPGNILWAAGFFSYSIDVFDLVTGNQIGTIPDRYATAMSFSPATGTVLICDRGGTPRELTLSGAVVRKFSGAPCTWGITRGPNGDVYSTAITLDEKEGYYYFRTLERWNANGDYLGSTDISETWPGNIVWAPYDIPGLPANQPPVLSIPSSVTINEGQTYSFYGHSDGPQRRPCAKLRCFNSPGHRRFLLDTSRITGPPNLWSPG